MDKLTAIKIKYEDGTYSDQIPVSVLGENVEWDATHTLVDILGSIDVDVTGTIQDQISQLFNEKVSTSALQSYVNQQLNIDVSNWLSANVNPVGSAVMVDSSLSIEGAAADAKVIGNQIPNLIGLNDEIGIYTFEINLIANQAHSSDKDKVNVLLKANTTYIISTQWDFTNNVVWQLFGVDKDGNNESITNGNTISTKSITLTKDYYKIGIYVASQPNSAILKFEINKKSTLKTDFINLNKNFNAIIDKSKNLFSFDNDLLIINPEAILNEDNSISNKKIDSRHDCQLRLRYHYTDGTTSLDDFTIVTKNNTLIKYSFYKTKEISYITLLHNGSSANVTFFNFYQTLEANKYYTIQILVEKCDIGVINGVSLKNIQIEEGQYATSYVNPIIPKKTDEEEVLSYNSWEQGTFESSGKISSSLRCRLKSFLAKKSSYIFCKSTEQYYEVAIFDKSSEVTPTQIKFITSEWISGESWYYIEEDCYVIVIAANGPTYSTSTAITPNQVEVSVSVLKNVNDLFYRQIVRSPYEVKPFIGNDGNMYWEKGTNGSLNIIIDSSHSLNLLISQTTSPINFSQAIIHEMLPNNSTLYDDHIVINIPYYQALCLDFLTNTIKLKQFPKLLKTDIVLAATGWSAPVGPLIDICTRKGLTKLETKVNNLQKDPQYFNKMQDYALLIYGDHLVQDKIAPTDFENFLFFTDPHTMYGNYTENPNNRTLGCQYFDQYIQELTYIKESTPVSFTLCGGDWNDGGIPAEELFKLGRANEICKNKLWPFYNVVGNHDTNYQGKADSESERYTSRFSEQCLKDLWFRDQEHCYYTFNGDNTKFYVFDTGTENQNLNSYNNYLSNQLKWFANALLNDNSSHIALTMHIWFYNGENIQPFSRMILEIACAYNARTTYEYDGITYDFTQNTGKIEFVIVGHSHRDFNTTFTYNNQTLSIIGSINAGSNNGSGYYGAPHVLCDLVHVNYQTRQLFTIRIGNYGTDREIAI